MSIRNRRLGSLRERLFERCDIASLVAYRIAFGTILMWEVWRYFRSGWIGAYWTEPQLHFKYYGFSWVEPWAGDLMYLHWAVLGVAAGCIALGLFYRVATVVFFAGFTWVFLLDQATYLNHFYLICLLGFLLIFLPAHRAFSLDARLWPGLRTRTIPAWPVWLLRGQLAIVYFYAGLAKLNADWLDGEPLTSWLSSDPPIPLIDTWLAHESAGLWLSYGGLAFDLVVAPALLWRRTRPVAFALAVGFHLLNAAMFHIGIFPWFMLAATTLFFEPDWPRRLARRVAGLAAWGRLRPRAAGRAAPRRAPSLAHQRVVTVGVGLWLIVQLAVPLRHFAYPGIVHWNEEGHRFAWHMKLRAKRSHVAFRVVLPDGGTSERVEVHRYLTRRQVRKMASRPDMILQMAHYLADRYRERGEGRVEVYADVWTSLNGRPQQRLIDPSVDLARVERDLGHAAWVLPLEDRGHRPRGG